MAITAKMTEAQFNTEVLPHLVTYLRYKDSDAWHDAQINYWKSLPNTAVWETTVSRPFYVLVNQVNQFGQVTRVVGTETMPVWDVAIKNLNKAKLPAINPGVFNLLTQQYIMPSASISSVDWDNTYRAPYVYNSRVKTYYLENIYRQRIVSPDGVYLRSMKQGVTTRKPSTSAKDYALNSEAYRMVLNILTSSKSSDAILRTDAYNKLITAFTKYKLTAANIPPYPSWTSMCAKNDWAILGTAKDLSTASITTLINTHLKKGISHEVVYYKKADNTLHIPAAVKEGNRTLSVITTTAAFTKYTNGNENIGQADTKDILGKRPVDVTNAHVPTALRFRINSETTDTAAGKPMDARAANAMLALASVARLYSQIYTVRYGVTNSRNGALDFADEDIFYLSEDFIFPGTYNTTTNRTPKTLATATTEGAGVIIARGINAIYKLISNATDASLTAAGNVGKDRIVFKEVDTRAVPTTAKANTLLGAKEANITKLILAFEKMLAAVDAAKGPDKIFTSTTCHNSCHGSCHGSRGRR